MTHLTDWIILLQASSPAGPPDGKRFFFQMVPMFVILFVFMYLFAIRPQRKQERQKREMLDSIRKNDRVVTIGGLHATVNQIRSETLILKVDKNVQLKFNKSAVQSVLKKGDPDDEEEGAGK